MRPKLTSFSNKLIQSKLFQSKSFQSKSFTKIPKHKITKYNYTNLLINLCIILIFLLVVAMLLNYRYNTKSTNQEKNQQLVNFVNKVKYHIDNSKKLNKIEKQIENKI